MSLDADRAFIDHLMRLKDGDRAAIAALRHSLTFEPGDDPRTYPFVERFVGREWHASDVRRRALYAVAGLFAAHPLEHDRSLAAALGQMMRDKDRPSLELRFLALLQADADGVLQHLRQCVSLLASEGLGYDHGRLLGDLRALLDERSRPEDRDRIKRQWARHFYRELQYDEAAATPPATTDVD